MSGFAGIRRWFHLERPIETEIDDELAFHFQRTTDDLIASGLSPEEATAEAKRRFGDLTDYRQQLTQIGQHRRTEQRRTEYLALLHRNVRLAWRGVRRNPGFALVVALTLGLGIGINTSMFSVLDHLLFAQPALVRDPDLVRRVYVTRHPQGAWIYGSTMTYPDIVDLKHASESGRRVRVHGQEFSTGTRRKRPANSRHHCRARLVRTPRGEAVAGTILRAIR